MTSQLNYFIAQQRQAELVSRAEQARLASEARLTRAASAPRWRPAPPHAGPAVEAPGYPPLCAHGMNSLTDRGYDLALGRLRRG